MAKAVQDLFTDIAPKYDFLNHFMSLSIDKRWRDKALARLQGQDIREVLDLCAGTLDLTQRTLELFPEAKVKAVDFSLAMLEQGKDKIKDPTRAQIICADGHHLPFPDQQFDAIVCAFGIRNLENRQQAAKEIRRVLKPNGKLVVLEFFRPQKLLPKLFYQTYGKYVIPRIGGLISKNRKAYEYLQNSIMNFLNITEYENLLKEFGFKKVESRSLSGGIAHEVFAH